MAAAMPSPETVLKIGEDTVSFGGLFQSLVDNFLSDLAEKLMKTD